MAARGHLAAMVTLSLDHLAKVAPGVSFLHSFPGPVKSNIAREWTVLDTVMRSIFFFVGPFIYIPKEECGERHCFMATSARYPAAQKANRAIIAPLEKGISIARGIDGNEGSGVYIPDAHQEQAVPKVLDVLADMRKDGKVEKLWEHTETEFIRICSSLAI